MRQAVLDLAVSLRRQSGRVVAALLLGLRRDLGVWMPWTGETVCPVGNGAAAPLVTVLTERRITRVAAGAPAALPAPMATMATTRDRATTAAERPDNLRRLDRCICALL